MIFNFKIILIITPNHMVICDYMKTYSIIFFEINDSFVILYTILISDYIHKYFLHIICIIKYNNILIFIKYRLIS